MLKLVIPGKPIAKARPRFCTRKMKSGKTYSHAYKTAAQETEEGRFMTMAMQQVERPIKGAVVASMEFYLPIPKSMPKRDRKLIDLGIFPHIKKPDVDNLQKFAMDCLNGIAWTDDSRVVGFQQLFKKYDAEPRSVIKLWGWDEWIR